MSCPPCDRARRAQEKLGPRNLRHPSCPPAPLRPSGGCRARPAPRDSPAPSPFLVRASMWCMCGHEGELEQSRMDTSRPVLWVGSPGRVGTSAGGSGCVAPPASQRIDPRSDIWSTLRCRRTEQPAAPRGRGSEREEWYLGHVRAHTQCACRAAGGGRQRRLTLRRAPAFPRRRCGTRAFLPAARTCRSPASGANPPAALRLP